MRLAAVLVGAALAGGACIGGSAAEPREPGGRYLVYTSSPGAPNETVWIGDVEARRMRRLTRGGYGLVSPDGRTIAISRRAGIFALSPDGRGGHFVARGRPAAWLPDSRHLLAIRAKALVSIDLQDGAVAVIERREVVTWSISPDGGSIAYDVYRKSPPSGECWFDVYTAHVDGTAKRRLTTGGRSSDPVWGPNSIAYAYRPPGRHCFEPRVWRMDADGRDKAPVMPTLPKRFANNGYYGVRPYAWVEGRPLLLATVPTEWGLELALVDSRDGRTRKPDLDPRPRLRRPMYVDDASRDARYVVGAACAAEAPCEIWTYSVLDRRARKLRAGHVAYPDWNR